jgi:thioredoxin-like negative regulator of GroEL
MKRSILLLISWVAATIAFVGPARAQDKPAALSWAGTDVSGAKVAVPVAGRISVIAFVRGGQAQSDELLGLLPAALKDAPDLQVLLIVGGENAAEQARSLKQKENARWPIVVDGEFAASGQFNVHVWPTTVVVDPTGNQVAHIAGLSQSCATDLKAYLDFAAHKIDQATLTKSLTSHDVVADNSEQAAARHLQVAKRLIEGRELDAARSQIEQGLKLKPDDASLRLALAKLMLLQNQPKEALSVLDQLPASVAPPWQIGTLRGRALIGLERWDEAKKLLSDCTNLNPDPAEAHYLLGLVYQHENDWTHAAKSFRKAFESMPAGQRMTSTAK